MKAKTNNTKQNKTRIQSIRYNDSTVGSCTAKNKSYSVAFVKTVEDQVPLLGHGLQTLSFGITLGSSLPLH